MINDPVTVGEAAQRLRVSDDTIRVWIAQGRLHAQRAGRRLLLDPAEVEALVHDVPKEQP